jgi:glycosyltransferase involved in cell wall biosynthesis
MAYRWSSKRKNLGRMLCGKKDLMRVGIYFGRNIKAATTAGGATSGGAFTFQLSILNVLKKYSGQHAFVVFSDDCDGVLTSSVKFIKLERFTSKEGENFLKRLFLKIPRKIKRSKLKSEFDNALNKAVIDNKIELMWFATPAFEFVSVPYIYTVWDLQHRLQSYFPEVSLTGWTFEAREKRYGSVIPKAAYVVIGNQEGKRELMQFYAMPEQRIKTIPLPAPGFALDKSVSSVDLKAYKINKPFLFYPAQFWPHKNHILILLALKILKEKYNLCFDVVFTGSDKGNLDYIKQRVIELGLLSQVHFLNFVPIDVLKSLYHNAFALVFPSFFGPDNIPPLESFALGCPVISANFMGAEFQLADAALLFDPKNEYDLAHMIKKLYEDLALRQELIDRGLKLVQNYTPEKYLERMIQTIDDFEPIRRCWSSHEIYVHK